MKTYVASALLVSLVAVTTALAFAGCRADDTLPTATTSSDAGADSTSAADSSTPISPPTTNTVSAANGGSVSDPSGQFVLTILPGALPQNTAITLGVVTKRENAVTSVGEFGPNGLQFLKPATLAIKANALLAPAGQSLVVAVDDGSTFTAIANSTYANGAATASISHFSSFSIIAVPTSTTPKCAARGETCRTQPDDRPCCMGDDPDYVLGCSPYGHHCCVPLGGLCTNAVDCCNAAENVQPGGAILAECSMGRCCSKPGGMCGAALPCCSTTCNASGHCEP